MRPVALALALAACAIDQPTPCDPLVAMEQPIELATVVAAGKHADGTLYVVDQPKEGAERVFVSEGGALHRRRVTGADSGTGADGRWYQLTVGEGDQAFTLRVELPAGGAARMAVVRGPLDVKTFAVGERGDVLETVAGDSVKALPLRNLPGEIAVEYLADVQDGRRLVVLVPRDDFSYEKFRLFLGQPERVVEYHVSAVTRQRDGGTTDITFIYRATRGVAHFPSPTLGGSAFVRVEGQTLAVTQHPPGTRPEGLSFFCR